MQFISSMTVMTVYLVRIFLFAHGQPEMEKSYANSLVDMEELLITEKDFIDAVEDFTQELDAKVNALKNLLNDLRAANDKAMTNPEEYLYNPLHGYSLIRRMYNDWPNIELFMKKPVGQSFLLTFQIYRPTMPTFRDLQEASEAIYRLQHTYDLMADDLAKGILNGKNYGSKLNAIDCYNMASYMFGIEQYYEANIWISQTLELYLETDYNRIIDFGEEKAWSLNAKILLQQNRVKEALESIKKANELKPEAAAITNHRKDLEFTQMINSEEKIKYEYHMPTAYELGCRGDFSHQPNRFYCIYNFTTSDFLRLAPLKMEIISLDPFIVLYHEVLTEREARDLQEMAKDSLERTKVFYEDEFGNVRTSKGAWLPDDTSETTIRLNQRIEDMTGFDLRGSEELQVMNYGIGGHYDIHPDFFNEKDFAEDCGDEGNRMATVLFYLSDVEQGGATVFPNIEKAIWPQKGTAVVFYNLNNQQEGDENTMHGGCPVLYGSKWICTKWIRAGAQIFRRPCFK